MTRTDIIAIAALFGFLAIPLALGAVAILRLWNRQGDDTQDYSGADDYLVTSAREVTPAAYPREFEQEARGL